MYSTVKLTTTYTALHCIAVLFFETYVN